MKKILIATPMMPPTAGGPATHAKKLSEFFSANGAGEARAASTLFNFEKYKKYPSGIRHFLTFFTFINPFSKYYFRKFDIIFAFDGFTVALPAILAGIILNKKIILRIGGDFVYENFLYIKEVDYESYYENLNKNLQIIKSKNYSLYLKFLIQKFILEKSYGIIFNTAWQKDIFSKHYNLKNKKLFVIENPIEKISHEEFQNEKLSRSFQDAINKNKFIFTSITRDIPYKNLKRLKKVFAELGDKFYLDMQHGTHNSCLKRISLSHAYICASLSDISPNQVQEALSLKIPIIISKYTGITNYLDKQGVVKVIDPFSEDDIKNAILSMTDSNIYAKYKNNLNNFFWPQNWDSLFKQYQEIIFEEKS